MKFSTSLIAAVSVFLPQIISAHIIMDEPKQWFVKETIRGSVETSDGQQNPLQADGSNYPCHGLEPEAPVATYVPGDPQKLKLLGTAVHGGGSGQMSITYDTKPTNSSKFRVMTSWMGDHPIKAAGNLGKEDRDPLGLGAKLPLDPLNPLSFVVPAKLHAGKAVVAWTWFNKVGNREMYMKCATVVISGDITSTAVFDALPEMFRANSGNGCTVPEGVEAIKFKNPGPNTVGTGTTVISCDNTKPGTGTGGSAPAPSSSPRPSGAPGNGNPSPPTPTANPRPPPTETPKPQPPLPQPSQSQPPCVEGIFICNNDGTFSQCGSGIMQNMGPVAAGTTCKNGVINKKRSIRFSHEHMRRHSSE